MDGSVFTDQIYEDVEPRDGGDYTDLFNTGDYEDNAEVDEENKPVREGYTFHDWDRSEDADGNVTYTAHWHHVIEDTWDATKELRSETDEFMRCETITWSVTIENPSEYDRYVSAAETLEGAKLTTQDGEEIKEISEDDVILVPARGSVTLIATYDVSNNHELGQVVNIVTVKGMGSCPDHPEEDGTQYEATNDDASVVTVYTLYYDANCDDEVDVPDEDESDYTEDSSWTFDISSDVPTREGYKFLGWSEDPEADEPDYQPGEEFTIYDKGNRKNKATLYAVWAKRIIKVTFKDGVEAAGAVAGWAFADQVYYVNPEADDYGEGAVRHTVRPLSSAGPAVPPAAGRPSTARPTGSATAVTPPKSAALSHRCRRRRSQRPCSGCTTS